MKLNTVIFHAALIAVMATTAFAMDGGKRPYSEAFPESTSLSNKRSNVLINLQGINHNGNKITVSRDVVQVSPTIVDLLGDLPDDFSFDAQSVPMQQPHYVLSLMVPLMTSVAQLQQQQKSELFIISSIFHKLSENVINDQNMLFAANFLQCHCIRKALVLAFMANAKPDDYLHAYSDKQYSNNQSFIQITTQTLNETFDSIIDEDLKKTVCTNLTTLAIAIMKYSNQCKNPNMFNNWLNKFSLPLRTVILKTINNRPVTLQGIDGTPLVISSQAAQTSKTIGIVLEDWPLSDEPIQVSFSHKTLSIIVPLMEFVAQKQAEGFSSQAIISKLLSNYKWTNNWEEVLTNFDIVQAANYLDFPLIFDVFVIAFMKTVPSEWFFEQYYNINPFTMSKVKQAYKVIVDFMKTKGPFKRFFNVQKQNSACLCTFSAQRLNEIFDTITDETIKGALCSNIEQLTAAIIAHSWHRGNDLFNHWLNLFTNQKLRKSIFHASKLWCEKYISSHPQEDEMRLLFNKTKGYLDSIFRIVFASVRKSLIDSSTDIPFLTPDMKDLYLPEVIPFDFLSEMCPSLETISIRMEHLRKLPASIGQLSNLKNLNLAHKQITTLPAEIENLPHLAYLDVSGNPLDVQSKALLERLRARGVSVIF